MRAVTGLVLGGEGGLTGRGRERLGRDASFTEEALARGPDLGKGALDLASEERAVGAEPQSEDTVREAEQVAVGQGLREELALLGAQLVDQPAEQGTRLGRRPRGSRWKQRGAGIGRRGRLGRDAVLGSRCRRARGRSVGLRRDERCREPVALPRRPVRWRRGKVQASARAPRPGRAAPRPARRGRGGCP